MHDTQLEASSEAPYYVLLSFAAANRLGYGPDNARGILLMPHGSTHHKGNRILVVTLTLALYTDKSVPPRAANSIRVAAPRRGLAGCGKRSMRSGAHTEAALKL